jgi:branched-chain amino acid transport system permease protein
VALAAFGVGYLLQRLLLNRAVATDDPLTPLLVTFGVAVVLRNLMTQVFGADPRALDGGALSAASFEIAGLHIGWYPVLVLVLAVLLFGGLQWMLHHSRFGLIVRATSDNRRIVRTMGVKPLHVYGVVMGLSLAFAAVAGLLLAMRTSFTPYSGVERLLGAFEVVIIGGLGSFWGALAGGIVLGVAQLVGQRIDSNAGPLYAHLLFFVVLMIRPSGIAAPRK